MKRSPVTTKVPIGTDGARCTRLSPAPAHLRDVPRAELHLLDGGHWALETNLDEIVALARDFLARVHG